MYKIQVASSATVSLATTMPIGPLIIQDAEGAMRYEPQPDITAYEAARLQILIAVMCAPISFATREWRRYIAEHSLGRHFVAEV